MDSRNLPKNFKSGILKKWKVLVRGIDMSDIVCDSGLFCERLVKAMDDRGLRNLFS